MERFTNFLAATRNAFAAIFAWLVICVIVVALIGRSETISVKFLLKVLALSAWAAISFVACFGNDKIRKKGFMFSMTCFYVVFIPVEILMFYFMGIFQNGGTPALWIGFGVIVLLFYLVSALIDWIVMRKKADVYTQKLEQYKKSI